MCVDSRLCIVRRKSDSRLSAKMAVRLLEGFEADFANLIGVGQFYLNYLQHIQKCYYSNVTKYIYKRKESLNNCLVKLAACSA